MFFDLLFKCVLQFEQMPMGSKTEFANCIENGSVLTKQSKKSVLILNSIIIEIRFVSCIKIRFRTKLNFELKFSRNFIKMDSYNRFNVCILFESPLFIHERLHFNYFSLSLFFSNSLKTHSSESCSNGNEPFLKLLVMIFSVKNLNAIL